MFYGGSSVQTNDKGEVTVDEGGIFPSPLWMSTGPLSLIFVLYLDRSMSLATSLRTTGYTWATRNWVWSAILCSCQCWSIRQPL